MDSDLGAVLQSVLSDPGQMEQLGRIAQGLMGGQGGAAAAAPAAPAASQPPPPHTAPPGEDRLLSALGKALSGGGGRTRSMALLAAMRPYMRPEKQEKLDRAMKIAGIARAAGVVMGELRGDHGV